MNRSTFDYKIVDELALNYANTDSAKNKALKEKYKNELAAVLMSEAFIVKSDEFIKIFLPNKYYLFAKRDYAQHMDLVIDSYHDLVISSITNYNTQMNNTFRTYFYNNLQYIKKIFYSKYNKTDCNSNVSFDEKFNESENEKSDFTDFGLDDDKYETYEDENETAQLIVFTGSCILKFLNNKNKQSNETRKMYFKLFNTDIVAQYVIDLEKINELLIKHEQMILSTINIEFLNFFMAKKCEILKDIIMCPLKKLKDVLNGSIDDNISEEICPLPLPSKVYISFLKVSKDINSSTVIISQQKSNFQKYMNEIRQENGGVYA